MRWQLIPQGSTAIEIGSGNENVGHTHLPNEVYSFMRLNLNTTWPGLNDDGFGRDGAE